MSGSRSDHFKIVYIKGLKEVEPVPHKWKQNGKCWFPQKPKDIKLNQCMANNSPDKENWPSYACTIKTAKPLWSWSEANKFANQICNETDASSSAISSEDEHDIPPKRIKILPSRFASNEFVQPHYKIINSNEVSDARNQMFDKTQVTNKLHNSNKETLLDDILEADNDMLEDVTLENNLPNKYF